MFNSREIATAIWLFPIAIYFLRHRQIRDGVKDLILLDPKLQVLLYLMLAYTLVEVAFLASIDALHGGLIKDTILWFCLTGLALLINTMTSGQKVNIFVAVLRDNVKVILLVTFLLNTYTLPLFGELVLVPCITVVAVLATFGEAKKEHHQVAKLMNGILAIVLFGLLT